VGQVLRRGGWVGQDDPQLKMPASWSPVDVLLLMGRSPQRLLWVVDDVQNASGSTLEVLRAMLAGFANGGRHTAVLITQREIPWPIPGGTRLHLSVRGLPRKDALELVQALGLPEERFEAVYRATLGNPRYLRLSAQQGGMSEDVPFADHVLSSLAPAQRRALLPVALSWEGLRPKELLALGLGPQEARNLVSVSVLETTEAGLRMADPLARRLPELAPWEEVRSAHGALVDAVPRLLPAERFCHLVDAERTREALRILTSGSPLWEGGASARVYPHLLRLAYHLPPGRARGRVFWILAQFQRRQEDFVTASGFLERALEDLPPQDPHAIVAVAALSMTVLRTGHVGLARRWARRLAGLNPLARWSSVRDLIHGSLLVHSGRFARARGLFRRAGAQGRVHRNWEVLFMALKGEAYTALQMGDPAASLDACLKGLRLAQHRERPDLVRYFRLEANLARLRLGRLDEAEREYGQLLEEVRGEHVRGHLVIVLLGLSHLAGRTGDLSKAETLAREAVSQAEALMDVTLTSRAYGALAECLRREHKTEAARRMARRAMELSRSSGTNLSLPWALEAWDLVEHDLPERRRSESTERTEKSKAHTTAAEGGK
jgi:tetratricopeptide (TPR) repeat protein